jgi:hypothetical protein
VIVAWIDDSDSGSGADSRAVKARLLSQNLLPID